MRVACNEITFKVKFNNQVQTTLYPQEVVCREYFLTATKHSSFRALVATIMPQTISKQNTPRIRFQTSQDWTFSIGNIKFSQLQKM